MTPAEQRAIALTLKDINDGWGTLWGSEIRFDPQTGERLPEVRREFGVYDRDERAGLPTGWQQVFAERGWIALDTRSRRISARWVVTDEGWAVMDQWLPSHLKKRSHPKTGEPR